MTAVLSDMSKEQLVTTLVDLYDETDVGRTNSIRFYRGWSREALRRQIVARRAYLKKRRPARIAAELDAHNRLTYLFLCYHDDDDLEQFIEKLKELLRS